MSNGLRRKRCPFKRDMNFAIMHELLRHLILTGKDSPLIPSNGRIARFSAISMELSKQLAMLAMLQYV